MLITQRIDADDPMLGATVAKARALASRVDELVVLCDSAASGALPTNCRIRTFRAPLRFARGTRFAAALAGELRPRPIGLVAHMVPLYAVLAAPLVRPLRVPLVLWYTHWDDHVALRTAEKVCTAVTSVDVRSFPFPSGKLHATGHGIDVSEFPCVEPEPSETFRVLVVGRYSRGKGLDEILRAFRLVLDRGLDARLTMRGPAGDAHEEAHLAELHRLHDELELGEAASIAGPLPRSGLPELFARSDVLVTNHISPDKIVYEAGAACLPILASHAAFDELVDGIEPSLLFRRGKAESLADAVGALAATPAERRHAIGTLLRERVADHHSTDTWATAILSLCR